MKELLEGVMPLRFWAKVRPVPSGCWEWTGARTYGYGIFQPGGRGYRGCRRAHRLLYEAVNGPVPAGLVLDHLCRNRACVNPDHLEPVTPRVNLLRGDTLNAKEVLVTHCPHGHPYSDENTVTYRGQRFCRECNRVKSRRYYEANRERLCADKRRSYHANS